MTLYAFNHNSPWIITRYPLEKRRSFFAANKMSERITYFAFPENTREPSCRGQCCHAYSSASLPAACGKIRHEPATGRTAAITDGWAWPFATLFGLDLGREKTVSPPTKSSFKYMIIDNRERTCCPLGSDVSQTSLAPSSERPEGGKATSMCGPKVSLPEGSYR